MSFACGTLADTVLSLQLPPARQATLFLSRLGSLPLAVPLTSDLRLCNFSSADCAAKPYLSVAYADPYLQ